jgi:hypothetical protein
MSDKAILRAPIKELCAWAQMWRGGKYGHAMLRDVIGREVCGFARKEK